MRTCEQEISLLGFASSTHNMATDNSGKDLFFNLDKFGVNIDILV